MLHGKQNMLLFGLLTTGTNHCRSWGCFGITPLKMNNGLKKKKVSQNLQNKTSWHKTHPIPIPFLWVSSVRCFKSVPTATVRSGGILLLLYLFISMVFKPCTELAVGLRKRVIKALAWRCFVLLFNAILSVPAAGCSSFCSQALQTKCLG